MSWIIVVLLGLAVGLMSSVLGLGGGVALVPLLPTAAHLTHREAMATALFATFLVASLNTYSFNRRHLIDWKVVLAVAPSAALSGFLSGRLARLVPEFWLEIVLVVLLWGFAVRLLAPSPQSSKSGSSVSAGGQIVIGVLAGLVAGMSGLSSGMVLTPLLIYFGIVQNEKVAPTSGAIIVSTTALAALAFAGSWQMNGLEIKWGYIYIHIALVVTIAAALTAYFGRRWQHNLGAAPRKRILASLLLLLGAKVVFGWL